MKDVRDPGTMDLLITAKWGTADNIESALIQIWTLIRQKRESYEETKAKMDELKARGLIKAGTHYKAGKYLYLIYPMTDGDRKREYVGADPVKIKEALEGIERGCIYSKLEQRLKQLKSEARQCHNYLCYAFKNLKG